MSAFELLQGFVLAVLFVYSAGFALRKLAPETTRRWLGRISARLDRPVHARLTRRIGHFLQPKEAKSGDCGSGDGCGTCRACAPAPPIENNAPQPLRFRPRQDS